MAKEKYTLILMFVSILAVVGFNIAYSNYVDRTRAHKLCAVVTLVSDAYRQTPPTTPLGVELAKDYEQLRRDLGCD